MISSATPNRRDFVKLLGAGLMIAIVDAPAQAQLNNRRSGGRGRGSRPVSIAARVHIARDGAITVMTGKVECGQGSRAELTQAAAEELRVAPERITLLMADTDLAPDDGMTAGSRTTPSSVPAVRQGAAAAREALIGIACAKWNATADQVSVASGKILHSSSNQELSYGELAADGAAAKAFARMTPSDVKITPVKEWKVLGIALARPNARELVTGTHNYPCDITRPDMLYGKVLRPPSYGATLQSIDLGPAKAMPGVVVVQDESFIGVAAPTSFQAQRAIEEVAKTARWDQPSLASSKTLFEDLKRHARGGANPFAEDVAHAAKSLRQSYRVAYVQHAPMEPRAAVAEWEQSKLTVWTGTQNPFGVRSELERAFGTTGGVRVIVPDFGGGFGGKHTGEAAVEAARLARAAKRPVSLRWTRREEFTWAYFRPAGLIEVEAGLDDAGQLSSWYFININSGPSSIETPYRVGKNRSQFVQSDPPLRHGSYRGLAATANTFARECAMDELARLAGADPLDFRLKHMEDPRLRAVLQAAAKRFGWADRAKNKEPHVGFGIACGTEKGAYIATCAQVAIEESEFGVKRVTAAFECGAILNPGNLAAQVQGAITMGLGPALREEIRFNNGIVQNASFGEYRVPRFADLPQIEVELLNRPDLPSSGAGETPLISIAPSVANAVSDALGTRVREMPIRLPRSA
jgi:CO/xanthine dehydrogenase Mo-binding subunit